jgi:hypothetical protein
LPDLVKFSYIPKNELKVNENDASVGRARARSPDFTIGPSSFKALAREEEGHVLVLEFFDNLKGKKSRNAGCVDSAQLFYLFTLKISTQASAINNRPHCHLWRSRSS